MLSDGNQTDGNSLERFLTPYQNSRLPLKGRFRSGLEGASSIKQFGNLTGKQPCNNHNQMKNKLVLKDSV